MEKELRSIHFRKITSEDIPLLHRWFSEPHVTEWWPVLGNEESLDSFLRRIRSPTTVANLVFFNNKPIGYIQYYYIDRTIEKAGKYFPELPPYTVGTDQFIGECDYLGKGYGTLFIKEFITYLTQEIDLRITTIIVDPEPENLAAVRCYEKVGFKRVGIFLTLNDHRALLMRYDVRRKDENNKEKPF